MEEFRFTMGASASNNSNIYEITGIDVLVGVVSDGAYDGSTATFDLQHSNDADFASFGTVSGSPVTVADAEEPLFQSLQTVPGKYVRLAYVVGDASAGRLTCSIVVK